MDADVVETLAAHAEELADFDAKLYPKPWGDESAAGWLARQVAEFSTSRGRVPSRIRMSPLTLRALLEEQVGSRRFDPTPAGRTFMSVAGVPAFVEPSLSGYVATLLPETAD